MSELAGDGSIGSASHAPAEGAAQDLQLARSLVDELLPDPWPEQLVERLSLWKTGDLVPDPVLTWAGPADDDPVTGAAADGGITYDWEPVADRSLTVPYGLVVSQTCDIVGTGAGARHPFVDVVPVFRGDAYGNFRKEIEQFRRGYLVALTKPPKDGFWIADLRLALSVSKALLAAHDPIPGFATDQDLLDLAEALARKRRRPALHDALSEALPRSLDEYVTEKAKSRPSPDWLDNVQQVRLRVSGGRLQPDGAQLWVVQETPLSPEAKALWRGWFARGERLLSKHAIVLGRTQFTDLDAMSARIFADSVPVSIKALGRPPTW